MSAPNGARRALSYVWAVLPLITFGLATPGVFLYVAVRLRTRGHWLAFALYSALMLIAFITAGTADGSAGDAVFFVAILALMLGGGAHALTVRARVVGGRPGPTTFDAAVDAAQRRRASRQRARELAARDPLMAREMHIGRPDMPRSFDDGGLIDVNSAPPAVLAQIPGLTPQLVDQIVQAREQVGAFISPEDVSAAAALPAHLTDDIAQYAIFLT
jgi:hypothetical protein